MCSSNTCQKLPEELLYIVAEHADTKCLAALARTHRSLHNFANPLLYKRDMKEEDSSALLWASHRGIPETVQRFLQYGANPNVRRDEDDEMYGPYMTPLLLAAKSGHADVVSLLLDASDTDPNLPDIMGMPPLSVATWHGHPEVVELLLSDGRVDPMLQDKRGKTPLIYAASEGHEVHTKMAQLLLDRGVDPNLQDSSGRTALSYAMGTDIIELLLANNADKDSADGQGRTPLTHMAILGRTREAKLLLDKGVRADVQDTVLRRTPLSYAAQEGHTELVRMLLQRDDVNPDSPSRQRKTPLYYASCYGHQVVMDLLLATGKVDKTRVRGH